MAAHWAAEGMESNLEPFCWAVQWRASHRQVQASLRLSRQQSTGPAQRNEHRIRPSAGSPAGSRHLIRARGFVARVMPIHTSSVPAVSNMGMQGLPFPARYFVSFITLSALQAEGSCRTPFNPALPCHRSPS